MAHYDYNELKQILMQHLRENFAGKTFSPHDLKDIADENDIELGRARVRQALIILAREECILKHGRFTGLHGGSPITTYKLGKRDLQPKTKKTSAQHQLEAKQRFEKMNSASLRLGKAIGLPVGTDGAMR